MDAIAEDSRRAWIMGIICRVEVFVNVGVLNETIWTVDDQIWIDTFGILIIFLKDSVTLDLNSNMCYGCIH